MQTVSYVSSIASHASDLAFFIGNWLFSPCCPARREMDPEPGADDDLAGGPRVDHDHGDLSA
jgi:hypothetical protein